MIAIEGIPRSMYHGPMMANYSQGVPGFMPPSLNGGLQHQGFYFGEQKASGMSPPGTTFPPTATDEADKKQHQQQWKEALKQRKEYSTFKKVILVLQDNRLKTGDPKTAEKLRELNRSQSESCPLLKTILNVLLVSTAVVLLIAVIIVIIYTSVKSPNSTTIQHADNHHHHHQSEALHPPSDQTPTSLELTSDDHHAEEEEEGKVNIYEGEFKPRTEIRSSSVKCRIVPIVIEEGDVSLRQLCFEVSSNETL